VVVERELKPVPVGKGEIRRDSKRHRIAILAFGSMLQPALAAAEEIDATVANMRFVKPLDTEMIAYLARTHEALVTVEENVVAGGAGSAVAEMLAAEGFTVPILQLGLPDEFIDHGDPALLLANCGLDAKGVAASILARFGTRRSDSISTSAALVKITKPAAGPVSSY
jgi:1-deoxy-D-xylulose-5-phosphate synthase